MCQANLRSKLYTKEKSNKKDREDELVECILMNQSLGIPFTSWEEIIKAFSLDESLKLKKCQNTTKLVLQIFEEKLADFLFREECWPETTRIISRVQQKVY